MKFLTAIIAFTTLASAHAEFRCFGTEPFWGLTVTDKTAIFHDYGTPVTETVKTYISETSKTVIVTKTKTATITKTGQCNDGMSDEIFEHDITLTGTEYGTVVGCCFIK